MGNHLAKNYWKKIASDLQAIVDHSGIACFSEIPTNILMWSHYAASHTGVCVGFDNTIHNQIFAEAKQVDYSRNYESLRNLTGDEKRQIEIVFFTKSRDWAYEKEWRILDMKEGGIRQIPPSTVKTIILGCRMAAHMRAKILSLATKRREKVKILRARKHSSEFALDLEELEFG
jgi:hypothetical protein